MGKKKIRNKKLKYFLWPVKEGYRHGNDQCPLYKRINWPKYYLPLREKILADRLH